MTDVKVHNAYVWTDEKAAFESLVALDENGIFVASPENSRISEIAEQIRSGTSPVSALEGTNSKLIQLDTLKYIKSNRHSTIVNYKTEGSDGKDNLGNFTIKKEQRDELFKNLEILCSRGFNYTETQFSKFRAALSPLITIGVVALITFFSFQAAIQIAEGESPDIKGRHSLIKSIFAGTLDFLGPNGVIIVGGIISVLCLIWMVNRIKKPPFILKYQKGK